MEIVIKVIITICVFVLAAFCIYGLAGLEVPEEKKTKPREIAVFICYAFVVCSLSYFVYGLYRNNYSSEDITKAYETGYDEGYSVGYEDGYGEGFDFAVDSSEE